MSDPKVPTEQELEEEAIEEDDDLLGEYPRRGRPRKPPGQRRRAKLILSMTGQELADAIVCASAERDVKDRPLRVQDWARNLILDAIKRHKENL